MKVREGEGVFASTRGRVRSLGKKKPRHLLQVAGFWRRPTDSRVPTRFARYLRELNRLPRPAFVGTISSASAQLLATSRSELRVG